jgi:hypothetical protein
MELKKVNNLEELNNVKVEESIFVWDPINEKRNLKVSGNSDYEISLLEKFGQVGKTILIREYTINKQKSEFFKESLILSQFKEKIYAGNEDNYPAKFKILNNITN